MKNRGGGGAGLRGSFFFFFFFKHLANIHGSSRGPPAIREEICITNEASETLG